MKNDFNILFITPNYLSKTGGGSIGQLKIYNSLKHLLDNGEIASFKVISPDEYIEYSANLKIIKERKKDLKSRLLFHSNYLYLYKKEIITYIKNNPINIVILGNSRLGFLINKIKKIKRDVKVISHFDNVEFDYVNCAYKNKLKRLFEKMCVYRDEKKAAKNSDILATLTDRDINSIIKYYKTTKKIIKYPVCVSTNDVLEETLDPNLLFIGSLNYAPNIDAIRSLIKVFKKQASFKKIIIGGSKPNAELLSLVENEPNVECYFNFKKLSDFAKKGDILVSLLHDGAGMKVKVAEAISVGLLVVGTPETFVGYEDVLDKGGLFMVSSEMDLLNILSYLGTRPLSQILVWAENNKQIFLENYSNYNSNHILRGIIYEFDT